MNKRSRALSLLLCYTFSLAVSCAPPNLFEDEASETKGIIGRDDRKPLFDKELERKIGLLYATYWDNKEKTEKTAPVCMGFASSYEEITTALHCYKESSSVSYSFRTSQGVFPVTGIISAHENADVVRLSVQGITEYLPRGTLNPDKAISVFSPSASDQMLIDSGMSYSSNLRE
jgi:hypothetical protein